MKNYVTVLLAAAGLTSAVLAGAQSDPAAGPPNLFAADVSHRAFTVTGTVVSARGGSLVLRIDDHKHQIPFTLGPGVSSAELRAGTRVSLRYHPSGTLGQVADAVEVIAGPRGADTGR